MCKTNFTVAIVFSFVLNTNECDLRANIAVKLKSPPAESIKMRAMEVDLKFKIISD